MTKIALLQAARLYLTTHEAHRWRGLCIALGESAYADHPDDYDLQALCDEVQQQITDALEDLGGYGYGYLGKYLDNLWGHEVTPEALLQARLLWLDRIILAETMGEPFPLPPIPEPT
jgi:hypothetical protein